MPQMVLLVQEAKASSNNATNGSFDAEDHDGQILISQVPMPQMVLLVQEKKLQATMPQMVLLMLKIMT